MKTTDWSPQEDALLVEGHRLHGNKWSMLAGIIGGRCETCCDALGCIMARSSCGSGVMLTSGFQHLLGQEDQHLALHGALSEEPAMRSA